jgi:hypothetical protein
VDEEHALDLADDADRWREEEREDREPDPDQRHDAQREDGMQTAWRW